MSRADDTFLRDQAERCRWLASNSGDHKTVVTLNNMARDYESKAAAMESESADHCD